jgi:3-phosphoshikimate 1-carboxyvinyltransferase
MPLPDLIEIVPPESPIQARISLPGSKSITNRALILAALSRNKVTLEGALWSEDTEVMAAALQQLGFELQVQRGERQDGNCQITVHGQNGQIPRGGTPAVPLELFVGNAGTAARFLTALVCLGHGSYRLHGVPRMHQRPQAALLQAIRHLGYVVDSESDRLPVTIHSPGPKPGAVNISIQQSSQFASALLLVSRHAGWKVQIVDENTEESAYVDMTQAMLQAFPFDGGQFVVEPDASSGSYIWAANHLLRSALGPACLIEPTLWPDSGWQIDQHFPHTLPLSRPISRNGDLGDSIMTAVVLGAFAAQPVQFTDLGRLRLQECERVQALQTELERCGCKVAQDGDMLTVYPSNLHGATIHTYKDHRMAMCFACLGLRIPGIRIQDPACVSKTYPRFFEMLAAPPPAGLGISLLNGHTGQPLDQDSLLP